MTTDLTQLHISKDYDCQQQLNSNFVIQKDAREDNSNNSIPEDDVRPISNPSPLSRANRHKVHKSNPTNITAERQLSELSCSSSSSSGTDSEPSFNSRRKFRRKRNLTQSHTLYELENLPQNSEQEITCRICEEKYPQSLFHVHSRICRDVHNQTVEATHTLFSVGDRLSHVITMLRDYHQSRKGTNQDQSRNRRLQRMERLAMKVRNMSFGGNPSKTSERCLQIEEKIGRMILRSPQSASIVTFGKKIIVLVEEKRLLLLEWTKVKPVDKSRAKPASNFVNLLQTLYTDPDPTRHSLSKPYSLAENFTFLKPISKGAFGRVYLAQQNSTRDLYAIKVIKKDEVIRKNLEQSVIAERKAMARAQNEFVVKLLFAYQSQHYLYLVMEYLIGGDLSSLLEKEEISEDWARQYVSEIVLSVEYIHSVGIVHRDLKPDNILIGNNGHLKLIDFGLSKMGAGTRVSTERGGRKPSYVDPLLEMIKGEQLNALQLNEPQEMVFSNLDLLNLMFQFVPTSNLVSLGLVCKTWKKVTDSMIKQSNRILGTPDYLAPEIISNSEYSEASDWWAVGIIMYEILCGIPPFNDTSYTGVFEKILNHINSKQSNFEWNSNEPSPDARDLIERLLNPNPKERLGANGSEEIKKHPWFAGVTWDSLYSQPMDNYFVPKVVDPCSTDYFSDYRADKVKQKEMSFIEEATSTTSTTTTTTTNTTTTTTSGSGFNNFDYKNVNELHNKNSEQIREMLKSENDPGDGGGMGCPGHSTGGTIYFSLNEKRKLAQSAIAQQHKKL